MAQQQRYSACGQCRKITLQVRGGSYEVPHVGHILAVLTLGLLVHPAAAFGWCGVWAFHTLMNLPDFYSKWTCTECGSPMPPRAMV